MEYERFVVVYDADAGLVGEIKYVARAVIKGESCAACKITHAGVRERSTWKRAKQRLGVPVEQTYRDQLDAGQQRAAAGQFPCVLGLRAGEWALVLDPAALASLDGDPDLLAAELTRRSVP